MFLKYLGATEFIRRYPHLSIAPKKLGCDLLERICHGRSSRSSRFRFGSLRSWNARAWFLADRTFFDIDRRRAGHHDPESIVDSHRRLRALKDRSRRATWNTPWKSGLTKVKR